MAIEKIAPLAGHASSHVTETVYRQELRPVLQEGAEVMDRLFGGVNNILAEHGDRHPFAGGGAPPLEVEPFGGEDDHARVVQDPWTR
jgi:hypothetical protein